MLPLPLAASGLSVAMAEKVLLIWLRESCGTAAAELLLLLLAEEPEGELLPQAAMTRAALPATAVSATFLVTECKGTTSLWAGTCRGVWPGDSPRSPHVRIYLGKQ